MIIYWVNLIAYFLKFKILKVDKFVFLNYSIMFVHEILREKNFIMKEILYAYILNS